MRTQKRRGRLNISFFAEKRETNGTVYHSAMSERRLAADRSVNVVAFIGRSGAGKTTAIVGLIAHFVTAAQKVAAIKHTHHPLNEEESETTRRVRFSNPSELLALTNADVVFAEGFKAIEEWPRIELNSDNRPSTTELLEILDKIWRP
jgi:molybdopterin-guanine dinucleotide biosynthesis protein